MSEADRPVRTPWLEYWRVARQTVIAVLQRMNYAPADQHGMRRPNPDDRPHISILRERKPNLRERLLNLPTADWIGTVYFPFHEDGRVVIEVFGRRNLPEARRVAHELCQETGLEVEARLADDRERAENEICLLTSNFESWGISL